MNYLFKVSCYNLITLKKLYSYILKTLHFIWIGKLSTSIFYVCVLLGFSLKTNLG